jgi:hypothetical protein
MPHPPCTREAVNATHHPHCHYTLDVCKWHCASKHIGLTSFSYQGKTTATTTKTFTLPPRGVHKFLNVPLGKNLISSSINEYQLMHTPDKHYHNNKRRHQLARAPVIGCNTLKH